MAKAMFITRGGEHFPPMGIMQISATAKLGGHETCLGLLSKGDIWERIEKEKPDAIAYTGSTGEHKFYFNFNHELKKRNPEIKTIMGGPHATFFPEKTLEEGGMDAVCIGEGDYAFPEFLDRLDNKKDFSGLENIMMNGDLTKPRLRPLVQNLDSLPFSDRTIFYDNGQSGENPLKHFFVSRGCPYNCTYCFNEQFKNMYSGQRYVRTRSVDSVIEEIKEVREKWPLKYIKFYDDIFHVKVDDWFREFAEKYKKEIGLPFFALTRTNLVDGEMVDLFSKAGCKAISMSIESANPRIREEVLNRKMTNEQIKRAYKLFGEKRIAIQSNNILGLPTSTIKDDVDTLDFNIECGPKQKAIVMAEFTTAHPYPGTELYEFCKRNGYYSSETGFSEMHMSYQYESPLNCFTPMEKRMQRNLTMLGPVAVTLPWMRDLIVNHLIKRPTNSAYFTAFSLNKSLRYMRHIYPLNRGLNEYLKVVYNSFRKNWFKRMDEKS